MGLSCTSRNGSYTTGNDLGGFGWGGNVPVIGIKTHPLSSTGAAKPLLEKEKLEEL